MQIQFHTDSTVERREKLTAYFGSVLENSLRRFSDRITLLEVHLSDERGFRHGQDARRCVLEARLKGRQSIAVTHQAATLVQAVDGAVDKLQRSIERTLDRLHDRD